MAWWEPPVLAVAAGWVAGFAHTVFTWYRRHVAHEFTWSSRDLSWMSPLGNVAMLLAPAALLVVVALVRRGRVPRAPGTFLVVLPAAVSVLLLIQRLHPFAVLILAAGLAVRAGLSAASHGDGWRRWTTRVAVAGVVATSVAFLMTSRSATRTPAGTPAEGSPNVVVLILDTVRAASTSLHGYARATTPTLEKLGREGAVYEWAISPSSWTLPSHASMFTGRPGSHLSSSWRRPLDATYPTVAEVLGRAGWATGAFVGNLYYTHHESGIDRGFDVLRDFRRSRLQVLWSTTIGQTPLLSRLLWEDRSPRGLLATIKAFELRSRVEPQQDRRRSSEVIDDFLAWQVGQREPFFAFLNLYDAHDPYEPPPDYRTLYSTNPTKQDLYDGGIRYMDDQLARLTAALAQRGVLDNTLLIITADHGEQWGEHGLGNHGNSLYLPLVHVPLVIRYPALVAAGTRVSDPMSLTDLAATILAVTKVEPGGIPGTSLLAGGRGSVITETEALDPSARKHQPAERGAMAAIVRDSLQFIRNGDSTYQLFDVVHDYAQERDVIGTATGCAASVELDSLLRAASREPRTPPFSTARCRVATPPVERR